LFAVVLAPFPVALVHISCLPRLHGVVVVVLWFPFVFPFYLFSITVPGTGSNIGSSFFWSLLKVPVEFVVGAETDMVGGEPGLFPGNLRPF
jgi:hypothetical protein